ncbi:hypothetical protein [Thalassotalea maritima]|uniref:hypothetical protein n=1 Tax=Thalassotalea maritima TaxID=3242416 RepID=UPI003528F7C7
MKRTLRYPLAVIVGWAVAIGLVAVIEGLGHILYPPPENLLLDNIEQMNTYIQSAPFAALLFVILAWYIGCYVGGLAACVIAKRASMLMAAFVGVLIYAGALTSLMVISHPTWFSVAALIGIPIITAFAGKHGKRFETKT